MRANTIVTKILELSHDSPELLHELEAFRRSVTILFTDITGSTEYFEKYGDIAGFAMVHRCNDLLQRVVQEHGGRVLKDIGDAIMAMFESCTDGVQAAIEMQRSSARANLLRAEDQRVRIRIGLHYGSGIVKSNDVFGDVVNTASRVESVAAPEQIVVSDCLHRELPESMFETALLGRFRLKGKTEERDLFEIRWDREATTPRNRTHVPAVSAAARSVQSPKVQHLNRSGTVVAQYPVGPEGLTIGRNGADIDFPDDSGMEGVHAQLLIKEGQLYVRDCNGADNVYVRLVGSCALENDDVILIGSQLLQFQKDGDILAAAASLGRTLPDVTNLLKEPAAKFLRLNRGVTAGADVYPLSVEEVRFGRISGQFTFRDDPLMSRSHARVFRRGEDFFVEDLGSRNGTFVRVRGMAPVPIGTGILISHETFRTVS